MSETITHFMWGFQHHFRRDFDHQVQRALQEIGAGVGPIVLLAGFRATTEARFDYCIEPENEPIGTVDLSGVAERAAALYDADEESRVINTHPGIHDERQRRIRDKARGDALCEILGASDAGTGRTYFASRSQRIGDYEVHAVVGVVTTRWEMLPRLTTPRRDRMDVIPSLQLAVVRELLHRGSLAMSLREPPQSLLPGETGSMAQDVTRAASHRFVQGIAVLSGQWFGSQLHEHLDAVAAQPYEGRSGVGTIVLAGGDGEGGGPLDELVEADVTFRTPVKVSQTRAMRKVLEMSSPDLHVLSNGIELTGLGRIREGYDAATEGAFEISVVGRGSWELRHNRIPLLRVDNARSSLPRPPLSRERFADTVERLFPETSADDVTALWNLASAAADQEHGTMLVVHRNASDEAGRLIPQAMAVEPVRFSPQALSAITNIDGAVLVSPDAQCHAVGVILDGQAIGDGDPSRGARFNSALRYRHAQGDDCLVIIVSEDGMIDLLPDLMPRVARERVERAVADLEAAATGEINFERFYRRRNHLKTLEFYLDGDQSARVNTATETVESYRMRTIGMRVSDGTFSPNPEMNDSYFL